MKDLLRTSASVLLVGCAVCTMHGQTLNDSLIAHFPMDGSPNDVIVGLTPIVTAGLPGFCSGHDGTANGAACFDGNDFWSYGDTLDMDTADFSIAFWMNVDTVREPFLVSPGFWDYGGIPIDKGCTIQGTPQRAGYSFCVRQLQPGDLRASWVTGGANDDVFVAEQLFPLDEWNHYVLARCGTHQLIYVDGVLVADSLTPAARNLNTNIMFTFGALNRDPSSVSDTEFFTGALDDVRIYKGRCLSEGEIDSLAQDLVTDLSGSPMTHTKLAAYPNPASDHITIATPAPLNGPYSLSILDASERTIIVERGRTGQAELNIAHIAPGTYFVCLQGEMWEVHARFIKE